MKLRAKEATMPEKREYSTQDCGGPDLCSGCSSWRHGVHEDGSGDPEALEAFRRFLMGDVGYHCDDELRGCDPHKPRSACYCDCGPCTLKREEPS